MSNLSDFLPLVGSSDIFRIARTSNISLSKDEKGALIDITSGTFTQTFAAAATLGDGWWCYIRNSGSGAITLDPSGSESIDGLSTCTMGAGELRLVQCSGASFNSLLLSSGSLLIVQDQRPSGTAGGTASTGSYKTRTLNTVVANEIGGAFLSANQITLPAGTYLINGEFPAHSIGFHKARIYNVTDATVAMYGTSMRAINSTMSASSLAGTITLSSTKILRVEHRVQLSTDANDFGYPSSFGDVEVYGNLTIRRLNA